MGSLPGSTRGNAHGAQERGPRRPNIVLILADDMGYSDIGCYGSEIHTPNLDALAARGVRFTQAYNNPRCCPSRASLLTGLYAHQAGIGLMVDNLGIPAYQGYLNDHCVTIAEALQAGGYRSYLAGKWHVGGQYSSARQPASPPGSRGFPRPIDRGFAHHYGTLAGSANYFDPHYLVCDDRLVAPEDDHYYFTDAIGEHAVAYMEEAARAEQPFFLYVAYTAPHWPLHARPEDIARYRGTYLKGWDAVRTQRHETLKGLGILDPHWPISRRDVGSQPWEEVRDQDWYDARMAVYAAQIDRMDQGVGRVLRRLRELGLEEDTLVMFFSDNGGCAEQLGEGISGHLGPLTRDGRPIRGGNIPGVEPGPADTYMSYGLEWANASNSPFRLFKHWVHEGGISTPLIVHWPAGGAMPGLTVHQPVHFVDVMATCLDAAGVPYPREYQGRAVTPLEGESFRRAFLGEKWAREREICWEHEGNCGVRQGSWKLVRKYSGPWELYDMEADRTETNDLAGRNPGKVKELAGLHGAWAERCGVVPWERILEMRKK